MKTVTLIPNYKTTITGYHKTCKMKILMETRLSMSRNTNQPTVSLLPLLLVMKKCSKKETIAFPRKPNKTLSIAFEYGTNVKATGD